MARLKSVVCDRMGMVAMGAGGVAQGRYVSRRHSGRRNLLSALGTLAMLIVVSFLALLLADEVLALPGRNPSRDTGRGFVNTTSSSRTAESQTASVKHGVEPASRLREGCSGLAYAQEDPGP